VNIDNIVTVKQIQQITHSTPFSIRVLQKVVYVFSYSSEHAVKSLWGEFIYVKSVID